jgi:hypothetical protein
MDFYSSLELAFRRIALWPRQGCRRILHLCGKLIRMEDDRRGEASGKSQGHQDGGQTPSPLPPYVEPQDDSTLIRVRKPKVEPGDTNISQVIWPLISYPRILMDVARGLIDQGQFSIAVVVVHMACEVATEQKFSEAFRTKGINYLQESVTDLLNGYSLGNDRIRNLFVALTGDEVQKAAFWAKFKESATRRNKIMHEGLTVDKAAAEDSYRASDDLLTHFKM